MAKEDGVLDDDDEEDVVLTPKKKKPKKKDDDSTYGSSAAKKKRGRPAGAANVKLEANPPELTKKMKRLINSVSKFVNSDGRCIADPFVLLPSRRELPNYYQVIKQPVDIKKIRERVKNHKYRSLDMLEQDFILMCKNAREYNMEQSLIYMDSITLQHLFMDMKNKIEQGIEDGLEPCEDSDSGKKGRKKKTSRLLQIQESDEETLDGLSVDGRSDISDMEFDDSMSSPARGSRK